MNKESDIYATPDSEILEQPEANEERISKLTKQKNRLKIYIIIVTTLNIINLRTSLHQIMK